MFAEFFASKEFADAMTILQNEFPLAIWETFYVTVVSTAIAIIIGLPLGVLLAVGGKDGILPLPRWRVKPRLTATPLSVCAARKAVSVFCCSSASCSAAKVSSCGNFNISRRISASLPRRFTTS